MSDVLDLMPRIRLKQAAACRHQSVSVAQREASLTCDACGSEIDPWMYLRWIADDTIDLDRRRDAMRAEFDRTFEEGNAKIAKLNQQIVKLNEECQRLTDHRNRLYNEKGPDGRQVGVSLQRPRTQRRKP